MSGAGDGTLPLVARVARAFAAYRDGDPGLLPGAVEDLTPLLWHVARGQGLGAHDAEDVVQLAWLRLLESAERIQEPQAVVKWLMTTTRREAWRVGRAGRREDTHADVTQVGETDPTEPGRRHEDPVSEVVLSAHEREVLWRHVASLSERCRYLLRVIAFAERPDYAAVADALGMPVGSIGPTRGRCLATLRAALTLEPAYEMDA